MLLTSARQEKIEDGSVVRLDSTVTAALMHEPSDSSLLWDAVRVQRDNQDDGGPSMKMRGQARFL